MADPDPSSDAAAGDQQERSCESLPWPWCEPASLRFAAILRRLDDLETEADHRIAEWLRFALARCGR
ncbi:MAG: hypothetical protein K2W96_23890 [Gemmataceae bacterium]|nr:hypothetical protein [Gemmataceae bacterium]